MAGPGHIILQACCWLFEAKPARLSILFLFVISDSRDQVLASTADSAADTRRYYHG